jgi:hypothetical protein
MNARRGAEESIVGAVVLERPGIGVVNVALGSMEPISLLDATISLRLKKTQRNSHVWCHALMEDALHHGLSYSTDMLAQHKYPLLVVYSHFARTLFRNLVVSEPFLPTCLRLPPLVHVCPRL